MGNRKAGAQRADRAAAADLRRELVALDAMTVGELAEKYREVFGTPTRTRNKGYLRKHIAWRIQERAEGGLTPRALERIDLLARQAPVRWREPAAPPIVVPPLTQRAHEDVRRIIGEYARDAIRELGATPTSFTEANHEWVARRAATSFADIEIATLRIVARNTGSMNKAAVRLGLSRGALSRWFERRGLPRK